MDFLGVGPGELFLILILMLVVLGPERLPVFARRAGQLVVSLRNWVQRSPDAQMVMRVRQELEEEMVSLRTTLTQEVQNVRDEMQVVRDEVIDVTRAQPIGTIAPPQLPADTPAAVMDASEPGAAAQDGAAAAAPADSLDLHAAPTATSDDTPADSFDLTDLQPVPRSGRPGSAADIPPPDPTAQEPEAPMPAPPVQQVEELAEQVRALRAELDELKILLRQRTAEPATLPHEEVV